MLSSLTNEPQINDILYDFVFKICDTCKCIQLTSLVDPSIIYNTDNKSSLTPLWIDHHHTFVDFIEFHNNDKNICEVGGGSNPLYKYFKNLESYSVLDIYEPDNKLDNIEYILGNCETFTGYTNKSLILSHTFEHLYYPRKFLDSLQKSDVEHVYISVPNMKAWLENKISTSLIFNQHTFYYEEADIIALFSHFGFQIKESRQFNLHSLFFYFQRIPNTQVIPFPIKNVTQELYAHFNSKRTIIEAITTTKQVFIMPSYYIGQIVYYYLNKDLNVLGFLDNDTNKSNKRLYGTNLYTYMPNMLEKYDPKNIAVFLILSPYYSEMYAQIRSLYPDVEIIPITI